MNPFGSCEQCSCRCTCPPTTSIHRICLTPHASRCPRDDLDSGCAWDRTPRTTNEPHFGRRIGAEPACAPHVQQRARPASTRPATEQRTNTADCVKRMLCGEKEDSGANAECARKGWRGMRWDGKRIDEPWSMRPKTGRRRKGTREQSRLRARAIVPRHAPSRPSDPPWLTPHEPLSSTPPRQGSRRKPAHGGKKGARFGGGVEGEEA